MVLVDNHNKVVLAVCFIADLSLETPFIIIMDTSQEGNHTNGDVNSSAPNDARKESISHTSQNSQTASDFIDSQLQLEADAREALPYAFDHCTQPLGPLRQILFSCLTCNPPPESPSDPFTPAAVCYSCSIACHGEHTLVELFNRRSFTCDCGTTRLPVTSPCTLRIDPATGMKGPVHSQAPAKDNTYNQNCRNRFCGCGEVYNVEEEKGIMFQCLGLAGEEDGGCGEDWWHPECITGHGREWAKEKAQAKEDAQKSSNQAEYTESSNLLPPEFPEEDSFDTFICYKCVNANPWIKRYAGSADFLPPVWNLPSNNKGLPANNTKEERDSCVAQYQAAQAEATDIPTILEEPTNAETNGTVEHDKEPLSSGNDTGSSKKRTADEAELDSSDSTIPKKSKADARYHDYLSDVRPGTFSLFCKEDFRERFCRCPECYPLFKKHPQLLEEEESYEPPLSENGGEGGESVGTGSLLDRGEAALSNVDRVRAIGTSLTANLRMTLYGC